MIDDEHAAAIDWSRLTEAGDRVAHALIGSFGYARALEAIASYASGTRQATKVFDAVASQGIEERNVTGAVERWRQRLAGLQTFDRTVLAKLGITVLIPDDDDWPERLNDLGDDAPLTLWVRGNVDALSDPAVALVGSRAASTYGERLARDAAFDLARDFVVVSGGAFGIDAAAHRGCLMNEGRTLIVSAGGVDRSYPQSNHELYVDALRQGGAVVSEAPLAAAPQRHRFLSRNRLIAALGKATVVVEAPFRSGALSTARHALAIGREIGAFPGTVHSPSAEGCHELIRNGATLVRSARDIREMVTWGSYEQQDLFSVPNDGFDTVTERVWEALPVSKRASVDSVAQVAGLDRATTQAKLGILLLAGRAEVINGQWRRALNEVGTNKTKS